MKICQNDNLGSVRVEIIDNKPWLVAKDVAEIAGYKDTSNAFRCAKKADKIKATVDGKIMILVNESGIKTFLKKDKVKNNVEYKNWLLNDVLTSTTVATTNDKVDENFIEESLKEEIANEKWRKKIINHTFDIANYYGVGLKYLYHQIYNKLEAEHNININITLKELEDKGLKKKYPFETLCCDIKCGDIINNIVLEMVKDINTAKYYSAQNLFNRKGYR